MTLEEQIAEATAGQDTAATISTSSGSSLKTTSKSGN